jgi:SAM-dependent methyltransferase
MKVDLQAVRKFWEDHINNEYYTRKTRASWAYFAEIERRRYKYHYHLPELFQKIEEEGTDGKRLLEIGCGIGIDTMRLAGLGFREVVAVDLTEAAIEIASHRIANEDITNVHFSIGNAEQLEFEDGTIDVVFSFGVIHHTPDIKRAVEEIHRVLKPSGKAYVMIYHSQSLVNLVHRVLRLPYESPKDLKDHCPVVFRLTRAEARRLFSAFSDVKLHTDYPFTYGMRFLSWAVPVAVQRWLGRRVGWHLMVEATKGQAA